MRLFLITCIVCLATGTITAQTRNFPYQAVVDADEVFVRSGPGRKYYPTGKLMRGGRVTVHRHDPGGWYMVSPPLGSFSWIRADYVKRTVNNRGVLSANNVVVRVGSEFGDIHDVEQRRLSTGDYVEIVGEKSMPTDGGRTVKMYKINPPQGEYRWIAGQSVISGEGIARRGSNRDPFVGSSTNTPAVDLLLPENVAKSQQSVSKQVTQPDSNETLNKRPLVRIDQDNQAVRSSGSLVEEPDGDRQRLQLLDGQFHDIVKQETGDWDFTQLTEEYRRLKVAVTPAAYDSQIDLRLAALKRYQAIKDEYDAFIRLTLKTNQRDAQLLSIQRQSEVSQSSAPSAFQKRQTAPQPLPSESPTRPGRRVVSRFDGAGIVQRSALVLPRVPRHVLLAPNGRILAYLQAGAGINLDAHVGRARGVNGKRWYRLELQTDVIIVRKLTPVKLVP